MNTAIVTKKAVPSLSKNRRGATMVEYAIMLALILVIAATVWAKVGKTVSKAGTDTDSAFNAG